MLLAELISELMKLQMVDPYTGREQVKILVKIRNLKKPENYEVETATVDHISHYDKSVMITVVV